MSAKQIDVQIMGQSYILGCPEGGEVKLQAAVYKVDAAMFKIRDAGKIKARDRIAVLAALNLAFDLSQDPQPVNLEATKSPGNSLAQSQERLSQLLRRLDKAIESDGQLI
jgi:cell division protein ZapA